MWNAMLQTLTPSARVLALFTPLTEVMSMKTRVAIVMCCVCFSDQVRAEETKVIRLGTPDVTIGRRSTDGTTQEAFLEAIRLSMAVTTLEPPAQLSPEEWRQLEAAGFSPESAFVFRVYQNPSVDDKADLADADAWVTLEPTEGDEYSVNGRVNLTRLANNGLLDRTFAQALLSSDVPDDVKREVCSLSRHSQRVALQIQSALLSLPDANGTRSGQVNVSTKLSFDRTGVNIDVDVDSDDPSQQRFWGGFWDGIKKTVRCYLGVLKDFVLAHDEVTWEVTCGTSGCEVTIGGTVSGADAAAFLDSLAGCFL